MIGTSHGGFVSLHFVGDGEKAVGWDFHTGVDVHEVSDVELALMDVELFAVTEHGDHLSGVRDVVQVRELLLFLVVVDCGYSARDQHGHQDGHTFDPACVTMFLVVTSFHS